MKMRAEKSASQGTGRAGNQKSLLRNIKIPPRPEALIRFQEESRKQNPDLGALARLVGSDVGLSGAVLQVVNSPLFRLSRKVVSVDQAALLLGLNKLASVVRVVAIKSTLAPGLGLERFWESAEEVARACAFLAAHKSWADPEEAYTLGLFHDCGIPIMMLGFPGYGNPLRQPSAEEDDSAGYYGDGEGNILESEGAHYGINHAAVGYGLGRSWFLPDSLCQAIALHHESFEKIARMGNLDPKVPALCAVLGISRAVSSKHQALWYPQGRKRRVSPALLEYLDLGQDDYLDLEDAMLSYMEGVVV